VGSFLPVGGVAIAEAEYDLDVGVASTGGWRGMESLGFELVPGAGATNRVPTDPGLTRWLAGDRIPVVPFGTSDAVSGDLATAAERHARFDLAVESMEGAAAAQTALAFGLPFAEVRGISNVAGQRDKGSWEIRAALRAAVATLTGAIRTGT
jgi:futalosine hydrolase